MSYIEHKILIAKQIYYFIVLFYRFSKFRNRETIASIRTLLMHKKLHKFELAALANLCPETAEEVRKSDKQMEEKLIFRHKFLCVDLGGSLAAFVNSDRQLERLYFEHDLDVD